MLAVANIQAPAYRRREPEKEPLYQILAEHLETFLQQVRTTEHGLPLHVEKEMRAYLECQPQTSSAPPPPPSATPIDAPSRLTKYR